mmetsp:Transcript_18362/g.22486  ORF Transcript_18362/g.22486 Transcript_18362/m.22486 type:complete len:93 (+) Transcript_18362:832-1110(+)
MGAGMVGTGNPGGITAGAPGTGGTGGGTGTGIDPSPAGIASAAGVVGCAAEMLASASNFCRLLDASNSNVLVGGGAGNGTGGAGGSTLPCGG